MLNVTASPLHFKDALIRFAELREHGFWELVIHQDQDEFTRGLRVFLTKAQLESMRAQLNALLPATDAVRKNDIEALYPAPPALGHPLNVSDTRAAARDYRDFPGSIAPSLLAGEGGAP